MPDLLVTLNDRVVTRVSITKPETLIGRDAVCDVVIDNPGISRQHAIVVINEGGYLIRDLDSENGITVGGHRLLECGLQFDSSIGLGKFRLQLVDSTPDSRPSPAAQPNPAAPRNIVKTVTIDHDEAQRIQERLSSGPRGPSEKPAAIHRNQGGSDSGWLWWAGAAFVIAFGAVFALRMFGGQ